MIEFDKKQFKEMLQKRKLPEKTLKTIIVQNVKINHVPVIIHKEGSLEYTLDFNTSSRIYELLLDNKGQKEIDYL